MAKPMKKPPFHYFFAFFHVLGWITGEISPHRVPQAYSGGGFHSEMPRSEKKWENSFWDTGPHVKTVKSRALPPPPPRIVFTYIIGKY